MPASFAPHDRLGAPSRNALFSQTAHRLRLVRAASKRERAARDPRIMRGACGSNQDMADVVVCSLLHSALPQPGFSPRVKSTTQRRARHLEQFKPAERRRAHATFRGSAATYHTLCIRAWGKGGVRGGEGMARVAYLRLPAIATWQAKWAEDTHCRPLKRTPRPRPRTGMVPCLEVFGSWFSSKSAPSYSLLVRPLPTRPTPSDIRFAWSSPDSPSTSRYPPT